MTTPLPARPTSAASARTASARTASVRTAAARTAAARTASASARALLADAAQSLREASHADHATTRHRGSRLAALRTAAAVVGERAAATARRTTPPADIHPAPRPGACDPGIWVVLPALAPELGEWSELFRVADLRARGLRGAAGITAREADDLLRQAEEFHLTCCGLLGEPRHRVVTTLTPLRGA